MGEVLHNIVMDCVTNIKLVILKKSYWMKPITKSG